MTAIEKAKVLKFQFPALDVVVCGRWVWISGNTRPSSTQLQTAGLKFSRNKSKWYWAPQGFTPRRRAGMPYVQIVQRYGEARVIPASEAASNA
jgi:hypothetical protein